MRVLPKSEDTQMFLSVGVVLRSGDVDGHSRRVCDGHEHDGPHTCAASIDGFADEEQLIDDLGSGVMNSM